MVAKSMNAFKKKKKSLRNKFDEMKCKHWLFWVVLLQFAFIICLFFFLTATGKESKDDNKNQVEAPMKIKDQTVEQIAYNQKEVNN